MHIKLKHRLTALVLAAATILGLGVPVQAASIEDGSKTCTVTPKTVESDLITTKGTHLHAGGYTYTTNDGLTGPAYCIDFGLTNAATTKALPITGKYSTSPSTAGAFAAGYPQLSLDTFLELHQEDHPLLAGMSEEEYRCATQIAVWATLGQLGVTGTNFTAGRETLGPGAGDARQARVHQAAQAILSIAATWDKVYQTGMYIRVKDNELGGNTAILPSMTLEFAANEGQYGIKREVINGKSYYTKEYIFASATSTYYQDYTIDVWATGAPNGTMFTDLSNVQLTGSSWHGTTTWRVPVEIHTTNLNSNGFEYSAKAKLCIPVEGAPNSGEITLHSAAQVMQYEIYLAENSAKKEQSYIIADPSKGSEEAEAVLSWGGEQTEYGSLEILKVGGGGSPLAGAVFSLTGTDGSSLTGTTSDKGTIFWEKLRPDITYTLSETTPPPGYGAVDPMTVTVKAAETVYLTIKDDTQHTLTVRKIDRQDGRSLQGAVFTFEQIDGSFRTTGITDQAGYIQFNADELPIGSYKIFESTAPEGHELDKTPQTVHWDGKKDVTLIFEDTRKVTLVINKVDSVTAYGLPDATFEVYKNGVLITTVTTDANGLAYASGLTSGYFEILETIAPAGHKLDSTLHGITIDDYDPATSDDPRITIKNDPLPGLRIVKYDRISHQYMAGVTFAVYRDGIFLGNYVTDAQGEILIQDAEPGTYRCYEVDTGDDGHILDTTPQEIELKAGDGIRELVFFNDRLPGIHLIKVDSADLSKPIANAKFSIKSVDGDYGPEEFTTRADGTIDLSKLPTGAYVVTELECPGYIVDDAQRIIQLDGNETAQFVFTNSKKPDLLLKKLSSDGTPLAGVSFRLAKIEDASHYLDRTTDMNGEILWEGLEPGVYSLVETATVNDHILDLREHHVELFPGKTSTIVLENDRRPNLTIIKRDADTGEAVPGTVFEVRFADGHSVQEVTTGPDSRGYLENLLPGVYEISEKSVPEPWLKDAANQLVTLYPNRDREVLFENHKRPSIEIIKENSITHERQAHVKFQVWYASNNTSTGEYNDLGVFYTDEDGRIVLTEPDIFLRDGWFRVRELEPPHGFALADPDTQEAFIPSGTSHTFVFQDRPLSAICVWKYDSVNPNMAIEGAVFQIRYLSGNTSGTGGTVIGTYRTGANGSFTATGLKAGVYIIEELSSDGDHVIDTPPQTVYLSGDDQEVVQVYFGNSPKGSLLVKKIDSLTKAPLSDVEFLVTDSKGAVVGDANGKFVTDSSGSFIVSGIDPGTTLVVREVRGRPGYVLDDVPQTATVSAGQTVTLEFRNQPKGNLIIEKYDSVTKQPLAGARFKVTTASGELVPDNEGLTSSNGLYVTDQSGQIILSKLTPDTYIVSEDRSPDNYRADPTPQTVVVNPGDTQTLRFYNDPLCTLTLLKRDAVTKKPLAGAEFLVRDSEGKAVGPNNGLYITGTDGTVTISGLTPDSTIVCSEAKAPSGYILNETPKTIVVRSGVPNSLIFDNQPGTTLVIRKFISGTDYEPLPGVCFKVTDGNGGAIGPDDGVYYTDLAGEIVLDGIEPGTTVIAREIKTVEGYVLDGTPQDILIKGGEVQRLTFWNKKAGTLVIQKKDSVSGALIAGAQFQLTYASGGYVDADNGHLSSNGLYTTNAQGEIRISGIIGTVVCREVQPAPGYVIDSSTQIQTVTVNPEDTQTLVFRNEPLCSLTLKKVDSVTGKPVPGTVFAVKDGNGILLGTYMTGTDGTVTVTGLVPGTTVVVSEVKVPAGYVLDPTPQTITVRNGTGNSVTTGNGNSGTGTGTGSGDNNLTFENDPTVTLTLHKYIEGTANEPLAGVAFKIVDGSGAPVGPSDGVFYTDAAGEIVVEGLEPGTVITAREVKRLKHSDLSTIPQKVHKTKPP